MKQQVEGPQGGVASLAQSRRRRDINVGKLIDREACRDVGWLQQLIQHLIVLLFHARDLLAVRGVLGVIP